MTSPTTEAVRTRPATPTPGLTLLVVGAAAAAWVALFLAHGTGLGHLRLDELPALAEPADLPAAAPTQQPGGHEHEGSGQHGGGVASAGAGAGATRALGVALLVLAGWAVMVVAMMLPPALPLFTVLRGLVARRAHPYGLLALSVAAFVGVWTAVGAGLVAGDTALRAALAGLDLQAPHLVTAAVLAGAGIYQLTPLKRACLRACRTPMSFALAHWRGERSPAAEATAVSLAYGLSCVGCCWALMVICLAVGAAALPVMVVLAVLMAVERLAPWGRRTVVPTGVALLVLAGLAALDLLPAGLVAG